MKLVHSRNDEDGPDYGKAITAGVRRGQPDTVFEAIGNWLKASGHQIDMYTAHKWIAARILDTGYEWALHDPLAQTFDQWHLSGDVADRLKLVLDALERIVASAQSDEENQAYGDEARTLLGELNDTYPKGRRGPSRFKKLSLPTLREHADRMIVVSQRVSYLGMRSLRNADDPMMHGSVLYTINRIAELGRMKRDEWWDES